MTREQNIKWVNRLAWGHVLAAGVGMFKYATEGNYWAACGWLIWGLSMALFALTSPRRVW